MSVTSISTEPAALTMTVASRLAAPARRVWQVWDDPRQLERWWGPPTYPATVVEHDLSPGGGVTYFMTGPEGDLYRGWWRVRTVEPPRLLEFEDGFADEDGDPDPEMPTMTVRVMLSEVSEAVTDMTIATTFPSREAMDQLLAMGMEEGIGSALGQIDALLRAG
jgi:uncharacterized protein YndB with AHSA1/START domain